MCDRRVRSVRPGAGCRGAARAAASGGAERRRLDSSHVRRDFRNAIKDAEGVNPAEWTPRELRNSFVSLLSDNGLPLEEISRLVGHSSTATTEAVYRKQIRPVLQGGAATMDRIFKQE
ncbi:site-specific integrase [Microbispora rosea]|uniref:site-specific integrase n=1 Tax=Microbispora rosea TaxID=58117 RepID=UPI000B28EE9B|nr:site-specific integrase [Microbispora rosea]